ncbi:MAG: ATP-dependent helicase, partial [Planctomycetota bacterium]
MGQGASAKDTAVFYRVNSMSRVLEEKFIQNKIPYQIVRGVEFYSRKEIRDLLSYLKILVNPSDEIALFRIINTPTRGIGKTTIDKVRSYAVQNNVTFYDALQKAGDIDSLSNGPKAKIAVFVSIIEQFKGDVTSKVAPLAERIFIESGLKQSLQAGGEKDQIALDDVDAYEPSSERVAIMTLHAAKGLEFENVFIIGLEEGLLPHERSTIGENEEELEEERRLFFVGITRAKSGLHISYARYRTFRGQLLRTIPSQFL